MSHTARRSVVAAALGVAMAVGAGVCAAPASAVPVTVQSPIKPGAKKSTDIRSATIDYDRARGRLAVTLVMRGGITPSPGEGPNYSVLLFGPRNATGGLGQSVLSLVSLGYPANGSLVFNPPGTAVDQLVPVDVKYLANRVEFRAADDKLKNLPLRYMQVQTSIDRIFIPSNTATTDAIYGRFIGAPARP
ncbi:hypothetical protein [Williamsia phyllosphaerae]|uniref:Uncharacterized protein n=1 Tax=Williamsia phyllosphaerae TaxID=885042 RepID=A0ABQ1V1S8_9NOCA|nr:hypothetical protein [Williamsia phyllosphaerae]GGF33463.1 hypothetical protein GCM10007298_31580 [Williamsia phyllosphaerae]